MSKPLEDLLRDLAKSGSLNHITISYLHSGGFEVGYRGTLHADHRRCSGDDVVDALIDALTGKKGIPGVQDAPVQKAKPVRKKAEPAAPKAPTVPDANSIFGDLL